MAAGRKVKQTVMGVDPETGEGFTIPAGERVPAHLKDAVKNPGVFEDDDTPEGYGVVEQSGPYVGLSRDQIASIATARGMSVPSDATTDQVLAMVTEADAAYAEVAAEAEKKASEAAADAAADAEKKAAAEAKAKSSGSKQ